MAEDTKTDEIDFAVFGKGIFEALEKAKKHPEPPVPVIQAAPPPIEKPAEPPLVQKPLENAKVRVENGVRYIPLEARNAVDVIRTLDDIWHPTTHDSLACPTCKPLVENYFKEKNYDVKEDARTGAITITPKKPATR